MYHHRRRWQIELFLLFRSLSSMVTIMKPSAPMHCLEASSNIEIATLRNDGKRARRELYLDPGECVFTIPCDPTHEIYPEYTVLEGTKIFFLDWLDMYPHIKFPSPCCNSSWTHERSNYSKNKKLFPIYNADGTVMWGSVKRYRCVTCDVIFHANDQRLLLSLPADIRSKYPVEPNYAINYGDGGGFHLSIAASDELDFIMKTYGNGEFFSKKLFQMAGRQYLRLLERYISRAKPGQDFPSDFKKWLHRLPPSGNTLRDLYYSSQNSTMVYGVSHLQRYQIELQSVGATNPADSITICTDHTFAVVKNYYNRMKACFTLKISTGETAAAYLVESTSIAEVMHGLAQLVKKRNFSPAVWWSDNMPVNMEQFHDIFGHGVLGRLGLFHAIQRIKKTWRRVDSNLSNHRLELMKT